MSTCLRLNGWKFCYSFTGMYGRCGWPPRTWERLIVRLWNPVACFFLGHETFTYPDDYEDPGKTVCVDCCKVLS